MTGACGPQAACPVCATPDQRSDFCAVCEWCLQSDLVLGELTARELKDAGDALLAAGHAWDARAAALSARGPESARRVTEVIRGGPPRRDEEKPHAAGSADLGIPSGYGGLLDELRHGTLRELSFVEFTADGLHMIRVTVGEAGIPLQNDTESIAWPFAVPAFDSDEDVRRFQLAGGIGTLPPVDRREFDTAVLEWLKASLPVSDPPLVLLRPSPGWQLLERAAATARQACAPQAELHAGGADSAHGTSAHRTTADAVRRLVRTLPLQADHTLLLARLDRETGAVHAESHVLFPEGFRLGPGETETAEVTVYGGPADRDALYLPVLAGVPVADGTGASPVSTHQIEVGALEPARLTFVLRGPGEVDLVAPPGARTLGDPTAADVPSLIPSPLLRIDPQPRLELYFTVELSGADPAETEERLTFVRDVVDLLGRRDRTGAAIRVGAVGHYDHTVYESIRAKEGILLQAPVSARPPAELAAALAGWAPARRRQDMVSSLEDALPEVARLITGDALWDVGGRRASEDPGAPCVHRVVLIVARRPPAPARQHGVVPACSQGVNWQTALARLRSHRCRVMTRADPAAGPPPADRPGRDARRYADGVWRDLGADGAFRPGVDSAAAVARSLAPPWRVQGPNCPLAFAAPLM
ncbi:hypothetical protein EJ357_35310 [Streptomyces cyaneochromogenes]|uniref:Uncharacterized protein n=1 Tax=Streptomyces cyaneochromogenes TaxID=2496836 RepID=A0A3Q9EY98_9ACTN|nr:hypothetical protein [Streptomyces cyaneochromogenes]AZQ38077.1 hypothetical protein EJ357_35310 [Streptomyces cyaneochromogenes]